MLFSVTSVYFTFASQGIFYKPKFYFSLFWSFLNQNYCVSKFPAPYVGNSEHSLYLGVVFHFFKEWFLKWPTFYLLADNSITCLYIGPPGEPAGIKASNADSHSVTLGWTRGAENGAQITSYIVEKFNQDTREWVHAKNGTSCHSHSVRFAWNIQCKLNRTLILNPPT